MCQVTHKKQQVYAIVVLLICLTIIVGFLSAVFGENIEMSIVGIIINLSITGILYYGVKTQDTTHVLVWLVFSLFEMVTLVIGMSYYAIKAAHMQSIKRLLSKTGSFQRKELHESISERSIKYIIFSIIFGSSAIILLPIIYVVKTFYDHIQRREGCQPEHR